MIAILIVAIICFTVILIVGMFINSEEQIEKCRLETLKNNIDEIVERIKIKIEENEEEDK